MSYEPVNVVLNGLTAAGVALDTVANVPLCTKCLGKAPVRLDRQASPQTGTQTGTHTHTDVHTHTQSNRVALVYAVLR